MPQDARKTVSAAAVAANPIPAPPAPSLADSGRIPDLWLHLPSPPSANSLFVTRRDGKGRAKTSAYKEWLLHAGWHVKAHCVTTPIHGPVRLWIEAGVSRQRDCDNLLKPIGDLLSKHLGIIDNDRWIDDLRIVRRWPSDNVLFVSLWRMSDGKGQETTAAVADRGADRDIAPPRPARRQARRDLRAGREDVQL